MPNDFGGIKEVMEQMVREVAKTKLKVKPLEIAKPPQVMAPSEITQAGMLGGGNRMLILVGLGFVALIGGIMFFRRKRKVSYAK